ncbi:MAG TPA: hypothetical protein VMM56_16365 [Planctomycetaceae bacterium]|nr:hypothetical protein [Planctomycetaceae bacterium]
MSRKHRQSETGIDSDSFLDIIANIVGILIILIVVAGVGIGQAPLTVPESTESAETSTSLPQLAGVIDLDSEPIPAPEHILGTTDAPLWKTPPVREETSEPIVIEQRRQHSPQELARHTAQLAELELLEQQARLRNKATTPPPDLAAELRAVTEAQKLLESLNAKLLRSRENYEAQKSALAQSEQQVSAAAQQIESLNRQLASIQTELAELAGTQTNAEVLRHDATPVSEEVQSRELHFVVQQGKVAEVPIDALLEQVKDQIQRRKDWILRSNKHIGIAGPIRGFKMEYLVERQTLSTLDQLRVGTGLIRIGLTRYTIERDPDTLIEETIQQASGSTSRFLVSVRSAPADASCTFWVYPDSFSEYQKLKQLVHASGLRVSGRPLPDGIPIGGSPQGSRSAAQ